MQSIVTKSMGPSNDQGVRIQARMGDVKVTVGYSHELRVLQFTLRLLRYLRETWLQGTLVYLCLL